MVSPLLIAVAALVLLVSLYVIIRRQRHGGLAGGAGSKSPPRMQANIGVGRLISADEVSRHSTPEDLWLVIGTKVYDFTEYFPLHPGGEAMLRNAGADSTAGFSGPQHPARVWQLIDEFYIGDLAQPVETSADDKKDE